MTIGQLRFNLLRNALYHTARRRIFECWHRFATFVIILLGASATSSLFGEWGFNAAYAGFAIALIGAAQIVFDFGGRARDHQMLQRDYYNLLAEIDAKPKASAKDTARWYAAMVRIAGNEPPMLRAIEAKAHNDALDALGDEFFDTRTEKLVIPCHHRLFGGFSSFDGYSYRKVGPSPVADAG
ncbi:MAG: hypothetical protein KDJ68_07220 [Rhodobiaceae bacterium]|nr:hypothetical protein [Rhodobiaceae bacterium]